MATMSNTTHATLTSVLPSPTGPHSVARISADWTDPTRSEQFSVDPDDRRELVVWLWYPATPDPDAKPATYLPNAWAPVSQFLGLDVDGLRSHATEDAPLAQRDSRYPVVVLSPSGFPPLLMSALAEEVTSHGYVVVGV